LDLTNLVTGNIKSGVTINGVSGKASVVDTSDATAIAADIVSGKIGYVNGSKITGTATVASLGGKRVASGTATSAATVTSVTLLDGSTPGKNLVTVTGLSFRPSKVIMKGITGNALVSCEYDEIADGNYTKSITDGLFSLTGVGGGSYRYKGDVSPVGMTSNGFVLFVSMPNTVVNWVAIE
jgi:hypothetical protein